MENISINSIMLISILVLVVLGLFVLKRQE